VNRCLRRLTHRVEHCKTLDCKCNYLLRFSYAFLVKPA
jgi:hypothetical protein